MRLSERGGDLIQRYEGLGDGDKKKPGLQPYFCPAGIATLGYGHALLHWVTGEQLRIKTFGREEAMRLAYEAVKRRYGRDGITVDEAEALFQEDIRPREQAVERRIDIRTTTQGQFDAMVSLTYNIGSAHFDSSTVLKRHNSMRRDPGGRDKDILRARSQKGQITNMSEAFCAWAKSDGVWLEGLFKRRFDESGMYFGSPAG